MILFCSDLDNTLIYSYKHDIGTAKRCAEIYQGRKISFLTEQTYELLKEVQKHVLLVPTTTRSVEQYQRIDLGIGTLKYALVCNGGVLLVDGKEDLEWYRQSLELVSESRTMLSYGAWLLDRDKNRCFEVRNIQGLFIFTKSEKPLASVKMLKQSLDLKRVDVFYNGIKVYIVPKKLNKGVAALRLKDKLKADRLIAAGDSEFDIPMLNCADFAVAPLALQKNKKFLKGVEYMPEEGIFSEGMLFALRKFYS